MHTPASLHQRIVAFLITLPNVNTINGRQALIYQANLDEQLQNQIEWGGSSSHFFPALVQTLVKYGQLHDGRSPLEALLQAAKQLVGADKRTLCGKLLQEIQALSLTVPSLPGKYSLKELRNHHEPLYTYLVAIQKRYRIVHILGIEKPVPLNDIYIHINILDKPSIFSRSFKEQVEATFLKNYSFGKRIKKRKAGISTVKENIGGCDKVPGVPHVLFFSFFKNSRHFRK